MPPKRGDRETNILGQVNPSASFRPNRITYREPGNCGPSTEWCRLRGVLIERLMQIHCLYWEPPLTREEHSIEPWTWGTVAKCCPD